MLLLLCGVSATDYLKLFKFIYDHDVLDLFLCQNVKMGKNLCGEWWYGTLLCLLGWPRSLSNDS